ncbi:phage holin family protein [Candidatus Kaiserbacteria bacterium]|nr:phage holin family protein [Candidatus Kaiserbacteria bacterium]
MTHIIARVLLTALTLLVIERFIDGITVEGLYYAIIAAIVIGLLNLVVRPVLFVLSLPITILTLGLFTFVINALIFWFAASFVEGFYVSGFMTAFVGSLIVTFVSTIGSKFLE